MTTPQDARSQRAARVERAVAGVVVGVLGLALVGFVVAVIGYHAIIGGWAAQREAAATPAPPASATESSGAGGRSVEGVDLSNEAYRQRVGSAEAHAEAARSLPEVQAALDPLATGDPVEHEDVVDALVDAGFESVQVSEGTAATDVGPTTLGVGVGVPGGCVYGAVGPEGVTLEAGGPIADGGCLAMPAH